MCGFCAVFAGSPHWSELHGVDAPDDYTRRRVRRQRLQLVNALVRTLGCTVEDWHGGQYIVRTSALTSCRRCRRTRRRV